MAWLYADSSVLVKRHVVEVGTAWIQALTAPAAGNRIITAHISQVEVLSALNRRRREGTLSVAQYAAIVDDYVALATSEYQIVALSAAIVDRCRLLLETYPLLTIALKTRCSRSTRQCWTCFQMCRSREHGSYGHSTFAFFQRWPMANEGVVHELVKTVPSWHRPLCRTADGTVAEW